MRVVLLGKSSEWVSATPLDRARCHRARWRIVELSSVQTPASQPFRARLQWSADSDSDLTARVLVPRGTRICVYAASLKVEVISASIADNRVVCTVADGYAVTQNQWEETGVGMGDVGPTGLEIPPFAQHVRVDCADVSQLQQVQIRIFDGQGQLRVHLTGDRQPSPGVPLGEASTLTVEAPSGLVYRATFLLAL